MVQVVENWSDLTVTVLDIAPHPELTEFSAVRVKVQSVAAVPGFANLLASAAGTTLTVNVDAPGAKDLAVGAAANLRVRLAKPGVHFAHP